MDENVVALLVAGIPAAVAAGTFLGAEIIRARNARGDRVSAAVHELVDALVEVVIVEGRPLPIRWFRFTSVVARATAASTAFLAAVEEKDRDFALWVVLQSQTLIGDRGERVVWSSKLLASVRLWQIRPAQMRAQATAELPALRALTAE